MEFIVEFIFDAFYIALLIGGILLIVFDDQIFTIAVKVVSMVLVMDILLNPLLALSALIIDLAGGIFILITLPVILLFGILAISNG